MKLMRSMVVPLVVLIAFPFSAEAAFCKRMLQNEKYLSFAEATPARRKTMFVRRIQEYAELSPQDARLQELAAAAQAKEIKSLVSLRGEKEILAFLDEMPDLSADDARGFLRAATAWSATVAAFSVLYALFYETEFYEDPVYWFSVALSVPLTLAANRLMDRDRSANQRENAHIENIRNIVQNDAFEPNDFLFYTRKIDDAKWGAIALTKEGSVYVLDVVAW